MTKRILFWYNLLRMRGSVILSGITLLYGTGNPAKLDMMRGNLTSCNLNIIGLRDMEKNSPEVEENGNDPLENAYEKAIAYYRFYKVPVFSCDSGLYFDNVPDEQQPGIHVRNIGGKRLSDSEMIMYYALKAREYGGKLTARYKNAICLVLSENEIYKSMDENLWGAPFRIVDKPHEKRVEGFPIDSLTVDIESGKYFYDLPQVEDTRFAEGILKFFKNALKEKIL